MRRRRRWGPVLLAVGLATMLGVMVVGVEPGIYWYGPFLVLVFGTTFFSLAVWLTNTRRNLLAATIITIFLILRLIKLGNWLNLILLTTVAVAIDSVFTKNDNRDT